MLSLNNACYGINCFILSGATDGAMDEGGAKMRYDDDELSQIRDEVLFNQRVSMITAALAVFAVIGWALLINLISSSTELNKIKNLRYYISNRIKAYNKYNLT